MTSSMLAGERRWASARRGGMTVLGKVAVPKPINLPSQKLENHGLDPNVEIVPKGSLSWGSRPSSSTSNPWGSSAISPNSDGNTVSPRHPSGRPTSGGGRSRPSTAGSDRAHEPSVNQWGPNSRPSSASGVLTSNQSTLTTSRPLSAETRPGSSHLSRFAEPVFDNSMAWGPNGTADKLSIPSKGNAFSLSSGDFPTLGSEKDITAKSSEHDHESHVRPGSASSRTAHAKERNEMSLHDTKGGTVETWTRDGPPHVEEHWQGDPHQYVNPNVPLQHFDAWRGPPMNAPGVWYRGPPPPAGPPYPPVPHGGYPMEPFSYYRPQMPPPLANQQPGPPQGAGPRGHHPRSGDFYRPQMPDAFIRPNMPMRPGFYPSPVPYEGYFGPPMGYNHNHNPNDRDNPYMGIPPGPPVYNMCPPQNPSEMDEAHYRGGGRGPVGNMYVPEQMDSVPPEEPRGPYKVLRKRENERNADVDEGSWEHQTTTNSLTLEKNDQPRPSFHKNDRAIDTRRNEDMPSRRNNSLVENPPSRMLGNQNYPSNSKASNESWGKKSEIATPVPEVAQDIPANPKDASLIQKIEGLNAKVRASEVASGNSKEEQKNRLVNPKDNSTLTFGTISTTEDLAPPRDINLYKDNTSKSNTAGASVTSRQPHHGVQKGRPVNQDNNDGWRKKSPILGSDSNQNVGHVSAENPETKNTGESMVDPADGQAQRARMRELARQRAIQLQKEEEERIKEQKAKAHAKLEELNRRTLAGESTTQTAEGTTTTTTGSVVEKEDVDGSQKPTGPDSEPIKHEAVSSGLETKGQPVVQVSKNSQPEPVIEAEKPESKTVSALVLTQQPRKRNNKSSKNKPKVDDVSSSLVEGDNMTKPCSEIVKQEPPPHVESESSKDAATQSQPSNQYNKGPQHSRRMPRNHPQANNRTADRFHGNEVVWAPVRAHSKEDRDSQDDVAVTQKSAQSNLKSRRAEMERYVPKAVAKEMAQQGGTIQQSSTPMKSSSEDIRRSTEESVSQPPVPVSSVSVDNTQSKPQVSLKKNNQNEVSNPAKSVTHDWDPSDGWFMPEYPPPSEVAAVVKDEGNKGKKPAYNNRTTVTKNHHDEGDVNQTERPTSAKENRSSSHWQPKPQGYNNKGGEEHGGEEGRRERKPRGRIHSPNNNMEDESAPFHQTAFRKYGGGGQGQNNRGGRHNNNNNNVNRERPRQNLHYEYQPVGSNKAEAAADGSGNTGPRYKERGTGQPRRGGGGGNFYGRQ